MNISKALKIMYPGIVVGPESPTEVTNLGNGAYISRWDESLGPQPTAEQMQTALDEHGAEYEAKITVSQLWQFCTDYQSVRLDGNGVGAMIGKIMQATLGGTPHTKADANIAWWQGLWADYEARRAAVLEGETVDMDFSTHGDIPYRVAEAMAEGNP